MEYFFNIDGQNIGPLSKEQIIDFINSEKIKLDTLSWKKGMEQWALVKDLPEILPIFKEIQKSSDLPPPIIPSLSSKKNFADLGNRIAAGLIDGIIVMVAIIIAMSVNEVIGLIVSLIGGLSYYLYFMSDNGGGQTIGYKLVKIKLVGEDTMKSISLGQAFLWYLVFAFAGVIGWIWFFNDEKRRMLHNLASRTIVISVRENL